MADLKDISPAKGAKLLSDAKVYQDKPYNTGAGPASNPTDGFDCSGLVWYVINKINGYQFDYRSTSTLAAHPMLRALKVPPDALQAGDIMLFHGHVGFYDPAPPTPGKTLYSATSHGVRNEDPKYWGTALGYYRLKVVTP